VNLTSATGGVSVTFCPLTGSSLVFDRSAIGGSELGVSGLLWRNNLIMYDRETESLWPQMLRASTCGVSKRTLLPQSPALEIRWDAWTELHPDGMVVSVQTGFGRAYDKYPYGDYDLPDNPETLFPHPSYDHRRGPKERLLGIILGGDGGVVFAYEILARAAVRAIHTRATGGGAVVFWDRAAESAVAYYRTVDGQELSFVVRGGDIRDEGTQSVWDLAGRAIAGPLAGTRLAAVPDSYTAFWFAWVTFQPETVVWFP
jgi:hypothetical protein